MSRLHRAVVLVCLATSVLPRGDVAASTVCAGAESALESISKALDEGRWDEAEQSLRPLEQSHPDCRQVVVAAARLSAVQGDPAEAERLFSRALTLAPDDAFAYALFARFQLLRGLRSQAAHLSVQSLAIDPDCPGALVVQGQILGQQGRLGRLEPRSRGRPPLILPTSRHIMSSASGSSASIASTWLRSGSRWRSPCDRRGTNRAVTSPSASRCWG